MDHKSKSVVGQTILERFGQHCMVKPENNGQDINIVSDMVRMSFNQKGQVFVAVNMASDAMQIGQVCAHLGGAFNHSLVFASPFLTTWEIETGKEITVSVATHPDTFAKYYREHIQQLAALSLMANKDKAEGIQDGINKL